jgi:hypothetical protein
MGNEARHEHEEEVMALFSFTAIHPIYNNSMTIDSGKATAREAFDDIRAYCVRMGYPQPEHVSQIKDEAAKYTFEDLQHMRADHTLVVRFGSFGSQRARFCRFVKTKKGGVDLMVEKWIASQRKWKGPVRITIGEILSA